MSTATSSSSLPAIRQGARLVDSGRASLAAALVLTLLSSMVLAGGLHAH